MSQPFKLSNNKMSPLEAAREFAQLSLKDARRRSVSLASSSYSPQSQYQDENAIIDDEDNESVLSSPRLLATSVDNNRLLPSLSTISLLSLNREQVSDLPLPMTPTITSNIIGLSPDYKRKPSISRGTSFSHSRVSSFHHQRHSSFYQQQRRMSQQQPLQSQNAQIPQQINQPMPETPTFGPTSVSGSPSGFYLGNQTLPASLQRGNGFPPSMIRQNSTSSQISVMSSPRLNPTTSNSEVPMTPLLLTQPLLESEENPLK